MEEDQKYNMDRELSQWEGEGYQQLSPSEEVQSHLHMFPWEGDKGEPELSQLGDNNNKEDCQGEGYSLQNLAQWEKDSSDHQLSQLEESASSQEPSQWEQYIRYEIDDDPLHPETDEDAQTCAQQGPGSPSSVGTQVAGEAAPELPSTSPAPGSPTEDELAAAAAAAGAAEEVEEPPEPLAAEVGKSPGSPAGSEEVPWAGTETPVPAPASPPGCCQALLGLAGNISSEELLQPVLEVQQPEEQGALQQSTAAEREAAAAVERGESPTAAPHSPCCPPSPSPSPAGAQGLSEQQEEADRASVLAEEESKEGATAEKLEDSQCKGEEHTDLFQREANKYQEGSQGEACIEQVLPPEETNNYQEGSQGEACIEQELPPEETNSYQEGSQGEACIEQEISPADTSNYQEGSQGEACIEQEISPEETNNYQDGSQGEACIEQELSPAETISNKVSQRESFIRQVISQEEADIYNMLSDWDEYTEDELSHDDVESYQEASDWGEFPEQGLSQAQVSISHSLSDWEDYSQQELSHGDFNCLQEVSDWEESIVQQLSQEEDSIAQKVCGGNGRRASVQSTWESDSEQDLVLYRWEENIGDKAFLHEEDDWDEISVLELHEDQSREPRLARGGFLLPGGIFVPILREGWVEDEASEPRPWGLLCASPPHVEALAPRGHGAPGAFQEQEPEAGTLSQQRAPRKKRLSRLRRALRALRGLFCFSCRAPQPQD